MKYTLINHSSHGHNLILKQIEVPYMCDGCEERGSLSCYQCDQECNFHLHEACAMPDLSIYPKFFDHAEFRFFKKNPGGESKVCDICGRNILGFMYQSIDGIYDLHPCCPNLDDLIILPIDDDEEIHLYLQKSATSKCKGCKRKAVSNQVKGWCYNSSSGKYCYHVACVKAMVLDEWKKNYLNNNNEDNSSRLALKRIVSSREVTRSNNGSSSSSTLRKTLKYGKKGALILGTIMSAIFGDPFSFFFVSAELFTSSN